MRGELASIGWEPALGRVVSMLHITTTPTLAPPSSELLTFVSPKHTDLVTSGIIHVLLTYHS